MRFILLLALVVAGLVVAYVLQRRKPDPPTSPSYRAPTQLDPADFDFTDLDKYFVLFSSNKCESCASTWSSLKQFENESCGLVKVDIEADLDLTAKYKIDGVPTTLLSNANGEVLATFFGPLDISSVEEFL